MAFPTLISNTGLPQVLTTSTPGPVEISGVLYVVIQDASVVFPSLVYQVFKSVDAGVTWAKIGQSANANASPGNSLYATLLVGTSIYIICINNVIPSPGVHNIQVLVFDTVGEIFTAAVDTLRTIANGQEFIATCYRASDNSVIVCNAQLSGSQIGRAHV